MREDTKGREISVAASKWIDRTEIMDDGTCSTQFCAAGPDFPVVVPVILESSAAEGSENPFAGDENVIVKPFRFMSADTEILESNGKWLSIPGDVLSAGADFWNSKTNARGAKVPVPLKIDHSRKALDLAGQVFDAKPVAATDTIPAGMEGYIAVDKILDPKAHRAVELGLINAVSTSWKMAWRPSHNVAVEDFWHQMGNLQDDGKRLVAEGTKITAVDEVSLVAVGADPFSLDLEASYGKNNGVLGEPQELIDENHTEEEMEFLKTELGLPADATETQCVDAVKTLKASASEDKTAGIFDALEVTCSAEAVAEVIKFKTEFVHRDELVAAKAETLEMRIDAAMHKAVAIDKKISPAEAKTLRAFAEKHFEGFATYLESRPNDSALPVVQSQAGDDKADDAVVVIAKATQYVEPTTGYIVKLADLEAQAASLHLDVNEVIAEAGLVAKSA